MREVYDHTAALGHDAVYEFEVLEGHAALHLGVGDVEELDGLDHVVGEVAVEPALHRTPLGFAEAGKTLGQIAAHKAASVADHMIYKDIEHVGEDVEHAQRQESHRR